MTSSDSKQRIKYVADWWTIDFLPEWRVAEDEECTSFSASPQLGILQMSAAKKPSGVVTKEDLAEFAFDSRTPKAAIRPISTPHASGLYAEYQRDNLYWREWWLKGKSVLLFVTYNVALSHKETESSAIDALISSLRIVA